MRVICGDATLDPFSNVSDEHFLGGHSHFYQAPMVKGPMVAIGG